MSEAEWIEMSQSAAGNGAAIYAIFLTIMSAYIVVAYMVGRELNRSQLMLINTFFVFSAGTAVLFLLGTLQKHTLAYNQAALTIKALEPYSEIAILAGQLFLGLGNSMFMLASLKFMWDVRHPGAA